MTGTVQRVAIGSWVLVLVLSGLVVSGGLWGAAESGRSVRAAPPPPPAAGVCLSDVDSLEPAPCTLPHAAEVILSWTGTVPDQAVDRSVLPLEHFPDDDPETHCAQAQVTFLGVGEPVEYTDGIRWFRSTPPVTVRLVHGPPGPSVPDWSWSACVLELWSAAGDVVLVDRSLRDLGRVPDLALPDEARSCVRDGADWPEWLPCSEPHRVEPVAYGEITLTESQLEQMVVQLRSDDPGEPSGVLLSDGPGALQLELPQAQDQCRTLAEQHLGAPLEVHAPTLQADLVLTSPFYATVDGGGFTNDAGFYGNAEPVGVSAECRVTFTGDQELVGSVAGVGTGPLPLG